MSDDLALATIPQNTIALYDNPASQMAAIEQLGGFIASSGLCGCEKKEQGILIAFTCLAERITPIQFARKYDIVSGKLSQKSASMLAEFRTKYGGDYEWLEMGDDGKSAKLKLIYKRRETDILYTIEDAQRAGLVNGKNPNWKTRPGEMLRSRVITKGLRMVCPEIAAGVYSPDEIADIDATPKLVQSVEVVDIAKLEALLIDRENQANVFFLERGWIAIGQTFRDLPAGRANAIIANPAPLLAKLDTPPVDDALFEEVK